jgi:urease accessory protein
VGPPAVGITREDLVTPPEFAGQHLANYVAGRIGGARIELKQRGPETRLGFCYQQIPLRVMPPFVMTGETASLLYLINLTAGLMDGDGHHIEILAGPGTQSVVTGQSATRIHPALASFGTQQYEVTVQDDACLVMLPGPAIPFQGCRYFQRGRVHLAPTARVIWGDIWMAGRYERGALSERFQFDQIVQDLEVHRAGRLIFRDRFSWKGPWTPEQIAWYFGGELATGSLYLSGPLLDVLPEPAPGLRRAVFPLGDAGTCLRWCGHPGAVTRDLVLVALRLAAGWASGPQAPPWLLESNSLSPNHWFSSMA